MPAPWRWVGRALAVLTTLLTLDVSMDPALAADSYPNRDVLIHADAPSGHSGNLTGALLVDHLNRQAKVPHKVVLVQPDSTAAATISDISKRRPNGFRLLLAQADNMVSAPAWRAYARSHNKALRMLAIVETSPVVCVVDANSAITELAQLRAVLEREGKVTIASAGLGSLSHVSTLLTLRAMGLDAGRVKVTHVALHSDGKAVAAVQKGTARFVCAAAPAVSAMIRAGRLRALFSTAPVAGIKVAEVSQASLPGLSPLSGLRGFTGVAGSRRLSETILKHWQQRANELVQSSTLAGRLNDYGTSLNILTGRQADAYVVRQQELISQLLVRYRISR